MRKRRLVIVGSGPAGYTAALYAARARLDPLMFTGFFNTPGGQLMTTSDVENFPGFPESVTGPDLMDRCRKQALRFGTELAPEDVEEVDLSTRPFTIRGGKTSVQADSLIVATGATAKRLDVPGASEEGFWQKGVTACAVCDGAMPIFRDKELYVIGGGDTAVEEALFLTKYGSRIYIVHRRDALRASKIMAEHAHTHPKITILWNRVLTRIEGEEVVESVTLRDVKTGEEEKRGAAGVFFAIGHTPNTGFLGGQVETDAQGYITVRVPTTYTNVPGVFAAGDVQDKVYRQAISAAGSGCMAALDAERWLMDNRP
ncbi:MAG: thioredoxin-disulfide reductase [Simkaniaceae bacterium]|nr:thioredoxin-disulfide reductase [Simkaniaceae bacterium]